MQKRHSRYLLCVRTQDHHAVYKRVLELVGRYSVSEMLNVAVAWTNWVFDSIHFAESGAKTKVSRYT